MAIPLMTTTLPTIIGMGVTSQAVTTMFGKQERQRASRTSGRPAKVIVVGISPSRAGANKIAVDYRRKLARQGKVTTNRVKIKKVRGGYVIAYLK